jgi:NADPH-dependent 2,4-dienoyl-CoA reductase/sulfur reductase-like enzyme
MYYERSKLHRALLSAATASTEAGVPVEVHLRTEVVSVDSQAARVVLGDGRVFEGDVVVGADGSYVSPALSIPANHACCIEKAELISCLVYSPQGHCSSRHYPHQRPEDRSSI